MAVSKVSDATFDSEVLKATEPVVVDFWAEWCGPCRMIAPALEEIAGTLNGKVKIVKLNVDENPQTAAKYGIQSIPTLMIFKNGELAARQVGAAPKQKLEQWITTAGLFLTETQLIDELFGQPDLTPPLEWLEQLEQETRGRPGRAAAPRGLAASWSGRTSTAAG